MKLFGIFRQVKILQEDGTIYQTFVLIDQDEIFDCYSEATKYVQLLKDEGDTDIIKIKQL